MPLRNTLTIIVVAIVSLICYERAPRNRFASIISHAMKLVEDNYIEEVPERELFENAMRGMVNELDQYSDYIGPEHFQQFRQAIDQEFVGIGVVVEGPPDADRLRVLNPIYDSPAYRAGVRAGDLILEIDDRPTSKMKLNEAVEKMKGPPGTRVTLVIQHPVAGAKPLRLEITRELIRTKSVLGDRMQTDGRWSYYLETDPRVGYIRITTFGEYTASELREVLPFADHPIDALILDLRGNVGGLLDAAVETCDMFIDEGTIVSTRGRRSEEDMTFTAKPENTLFNRTTPMIVLVDRYSASASEIVAACLQDHQRALVAGQRTWGKGTVQNVIPLEHDTSALKLTTASYWRPNGTNIHRAEDAGENDVWGVRPAPELEVTLTDQQYQALYEQRSARDILSEEGGAKVSATPLDDLQLQRAVEYLKHGPEAPAPAQ
jgi:carboxyl-terminal processing protease